MKKISVFLLIGVFALAVLSGSAMAQEKKYTAKLADILFIASRKDESGLRFSTSALYQTRPAFSQAFPFRRAAAS